MNRNISAVILLVLAVGVYVTFTKVQWVEVQAIRVVNADYAQAIENADRLIQVRDKVLTDYNSMSAIDRERINKMVPNNVDTIRLIIDVRNIAMKRGLVLADVKSETVLPDPSTLVSIPGGINDGVIPTPVLDKVAMAFTLKSSYPQFLDFMRDVETNLRIMNFTSLKMKSSDSGIYEFNVELETYWLRQQ